MIELPGYRIEKTLGSGGMSTVYLARQESLDRLVALKVMAPALVADPTFAERFLQEGKTIAALRHPNIITALDIGSTGTCSYMALEYASGGDLKEKIAAELSQEQSLRILRQIGSALAYAHSHGLVHRDIKPENILFEDDNALLSDFGIAKLVDSGRRLTGTGMSIGTPHYMSPEQARGEDVDGRSDLYSLGILFYEMLTGELPYDGKDSFAIAYRHIHDPLPELPQHLAAFAPLLQKLLAKDPNDRFGSAEQLLATLPADGTLVMDNREMQSSATGSFTGKEPTDRATQRSSKGPLLVFVVLLALVAGAVGWFLLRLSPPRLASGGGSTVSGPVSPSQEKSEPAADVARLLQGDGAAPAAVKPLSPGHTPVQEHRQAAPPANALLETLAPEPEPAQVAEARQPDLASLFRTADSLAKTAGTSLPRAQKAVAAYRHILELETDNQRARAGVEKVTTLFVEAAKTAIATEDLTRGKEMVASLRTLSPGSPELESLSRALRDKQEDIERRRQAEARARERQAREEAARLQAAREEKLEKLLTAGQEALAKKQKSAALAAFGAALKLFPNNDAARQGEQRARRLIVPGEPFSDLLSNGAAGPQMVLVPAGEFVMGDKRGDGRSNERPAHHVRLDHPFALSRYEITFNEFDRYCMATGRSRPTDYGWGRGRRPVLNVSWDDARSYAAWLSRETGKTYRLPSEAEWEYAARGKTETSYWWGDSPQAGMANCSDCGSRWDNRTTAPVGSFAANPFGLHDMLGNVWEWCADSYHSAYVGAPTDGRPWLGSGNRHVLRGGSWDYSSRAARITARPLFRDSDRYTSVGIRLLREIDPREL
ncbi:hypothetical protein C2E25_16610 [Geothermobacter hydrogeniphilus]|uniref:non-specific serine/threonine protein kinase n=1 Tax=Geothermobacter hydrogeniphilus TaxID=1969733 RepID=A0A2K2H605_9BACT|nr:bifunctional serine/threonine-protein kinase/formylglycine-generating enzyme family protein [Geothermobacter hydrogeniphilus]PNU18643.1 hypothetical protein C2E25_16610 [Geothermobacter hydrogeniphilus]